jgi:hypothetical protein
MLKSRHSRTCAGGEVGAVFFGRLRPGFTRTVSRDVIVEMTDDGGVRGSRIRFFEGRPRDAVKNSNRREILRATTSGGGRGIGRSARKTSAWTRANDVMTNTDRGGAV